MKKYVTHFFCVLILVTGSFAVSAQSPLTSEQRQLIQEEVLPVVFKQVNQQFGLDITSLVQPEKLFENVLKSSLITLTNTGKADMPMDIKPDSVIVPLGDGNIKLLFSEYNTYDLPTIAGYPVSLELPEDIRIVTGNPTVDRAGIMLYMKPIKPDANIISGLSISLGVLGTPYDIAMLTFEKLPTSKAVTDYLNGFSLLVDLGGLRGLLSNPILGAILGDLLSDVEIEIPFDINIVVSPEWENGVVNASLLAVPAGNPEVKFSMGDAVVALDISSPFPVRSITLTSYDDEEGTMGEVKGWRRLWSTFEKPDENSISITMDDYAFTSEAMTDSVYQGSIVRTISDYSGNPQFMTTTANAIRYALKSALDQQQGNPVFYRLIVEDVDKDGNIEMERRMDVSAYISGENAIAELIIQEFDEGNAAGETIIRATAETTSELIVVDILTEGTAPVASIYFTSNALNVVGNEAAPALPDVIMLSDENGLHVTNAEGAVYTIVSMRGAIVSTGYVKGNYIPTSLNRGIYILTIRKNGTITAFKFVR